VRRFYAFVFKERAGDFCGNIHQVTGDMGKDETRNT